jgi:GNAT superfamily N-acetyltransferase
LVVLTDGITLYSYHVYVLRANSRRRGYSERFFGARLIIRVVPGGVITCREELYQLFVSAHARGSGVAAALIADAETRLAANGVQSAWLACAIGNERAARFYEKSGWRRVGTMINPAETASGVFRLEVWRYEKLLKPEAARVAQE